MIIKKKEYQAIAQAIVLSDSSGESIILDRDLWQKAMDVIEEIDVRVESDNE